MMKQTILSLLFLVLFSSCIRENDAPIKIPPITGAVVSPNVGGPTQPHQVWIDLSENTQLTNKRDDWDLGFYSGESFKVILNSSIMMAAGKIENTNDIDAVTPQSVEYLKSQVQVGNYTPNAQYIDNPEGDYPNQRTAVEEINEDHSKNGVYLLNMGKGLYTGTVAPKSIPLSGDSRGWMKIKILREGNGYRIQYANLEDTTHKEIVVEKNTSHHFQFLNLKEGIFKNVQPPKKQWDLCFTVFTNLINNPSINALTSYTYPDVVLTNVLSNVEVYQVKVEVGQGETAYNSFKKEQIDETLFKKKDQRIIGSNWRTTLGANGPDVFSDRFYVLKDSEGFYFKIRFLRMKSDDGSRGYPQFEYKPL